MSLIATRERVPYAVAARKLLRQTLLDAARELVEQRPWPEVTMADIAATAGVSRQTVYNEFGSRAEFAQALVLSETDRFLAAVEQAVNSNVDDPPAALSAAFDVFLTAAEQHPLIRAVVSGDDSADSLLPYLTTQGKPVLKRAADHLAFVVLSAWPHADEHDAHLLAECVVRLGISHAALPTGSAETTAASVTSVLEPFLERVVGGPRARGSLRRPLAAR